MQQYWSHTFFCALMMTFLPIIALAQTGSERPSISISNQLPQPGERVEISVQNTYADTIPGDLTWRINNRTDSTFNNQRTINLTAGEPGDALLIQAYRGDSLLAETALSPAYVDIIVEPLTYIPNFYTGRPLPTAGSFVNMHAIVDAGGDFNPANLTYTWRVNNSAIGGGAVRGETSTQTETPNRRSMTIGVRVAQPNGAAVAQGEITIPIAQPEVHMYRVSSLLGTTEYTLDDPYTLSSNAITVRALPYYLPLQALQGNNTVNWRIGPEDVSGEDDDRFAVTIPRDNTRPDARIQFSFRHPQNTLYMVSDSFRVVY